MKSSTIGRVGIAFFLIILLGSMYLFTRGSKVDDLMTQRNKILGELALAKAKLDTAKQTLSTMTTDLINTYPQAASVQDQMTQASKIVSRTDFMFSDPSGLNPQTIIASMQNAVFLDNQRREINLFITRWQSEIDITAIKKIDINEMEKIQQEADTIKVFIQTLIQAVASLTPENSGLTQFEINTYTLQLPSLDSINAVLASVANAIQDLKNVNSSTFTSSNTNTTTPEDVIAERIVVNDTQAQIASLQEQLVAIDKQIQQSSPSSTSSNTQSGTNSPPDNTTNTTNTNNTNTTDAGNTNNASNITNSPTTDNTNTDTTNNTNITNPVTDNTNTNTTNNTNTAPINNVHPYIYVAPRVIDKSLYQGIIVQPGPPQLIEGTNQY